MISLLKAGMNLVNDIKKEKIKMSESKLSMSDEEFENAVKRVCELIYNLTLKDRGLITIKDIATYDALGQCVATTVTKTADAIQEEFTETIIKMMKEENKK